MSAPKPIMEGQIESQEQLIARLRTELAVAQQRARTAEARLVEVETAVREFKEKQERVAKARKAREERMRADTQAALLAASEAHHRPAPADAINQSMTADVWRVEDDSLDERLTRFLESGFEPDRSREWMLDG